MAALKSVCVWELKDFAEVSAAHLLRVPGFGRTSLQSLLKQLAELGIRLGRNLTQEQASDSCYRDMVIHYQSKVAGYQSVAAAGVSEPGSQQSPPPFRITLSTGRSIEASADTWAYRD